MIDLFVFFGAIFLLICSRGKVAARFEECNFPGVIGSFFSIDSEYLILDQPLKSETGKLWSIRDF